MPAVMAQKYMRSHGPKEALKQIGVEID